MPDDAFTADFPRCPCGGMLEFSSEGTLCLRCGAAVRIELPVEPSVSSDLSAKRAAAGSKGGRAKKRPGAKNCFTPESGREAGRRSAAAKKVLALQKAPC